MKYSAITYAKALAEAAGAPKANAGEIGKNFLALLRRNGDEAHAGKILEEAGRILRAKEGVKKIMIESARALTPAQQKMVKELGDRKSIFEEHINKELIAGIRIIVDDEMQFDGSLRGKLDNVFNNVG